MGFRALKGVDSLDCEGQMQSIVQNSLVPKTGHVVGHYKIGIKKKEKEKDRRNKIHSKSVSETKDE